MSPGGIEPVSVSFSEEWYHSNFGVDFSENASRDVVGRVEFSRELVRLAYERFGDVGLGCKDPKPFPNVNTPYGHYFSPALFGCEIVCPEDQAIANLPLDADMDDMARLEVPDFDKSPVIQQAFAEAEVLRKEYGFCHGAVGMGSPLNIAVNVYGEQFLTACAMEPEIAQHVLRVIAETMFKLYREVCAVIEPEAYPLENIPFGLGNCPAIMLSPSMYREVVLPVDKIVRAWAGDTFGIHHCGVFDRYIEIYQELTPTSLDIGGGSDYKAIREAFPEVPFSLIVNAPDIEGKSVSEVDNLVGRIVEGASPVDKILRLWVAAVGSEIDDETVRAVRTANERI